MLNEWKKSGIKHSGGDMRLQENNQLGTVSFGSVDIAGEKHTDTDLTYLNEPRFDNK